LPAAKTLVEVANGLPKTAWRNITWRQGTKGPMRSRFAQVKVWAAHGWKRQEHPPRVMEWLLIEWPEDAVMPTDYWLAQLGEQSLGLRRLVKTARARWRVEMDYRELKEELGLDHYEGRFWLGWHHHVTLVSMAFAFLRTEQAQVKKNFWCDTGDAAANPGAVAGPADPS
jgi:SRSO17 transposase